MIPVHHAVAARAQDAPDSRAVVLGAQTLTYGGLDLLGNAFASALVDAGARPDGRVCLLVPRSPEAVAAVLGVLRAGCVYVPLDPDSPPDRLRGILRDADPGHVLVHPGRLALAEECLRGLPPDRRPVLVRTDEAATAPGATRPLLRTAPGGLAYLLFTSGSTGRPKGVPIRHASVTHFVGWANGHFGLGPHDRVSGHSPLHFDLSVWDVFGALTSGAELHLVPQEANLLPQRLAAFVRDSGLTQWFSVPSALVPMAARDVLSRVELPRLRRLIWCGEVFPTHAVRYFRDRLPHVRLTNLYGPTEATVASGYHEVTALPESDATPVPLGRPIPGERFAVLRPDGRPAARGEIGQLHIGGAGLSPGYWRAPERTADAFRTLGAPGAGDRWYRTGDLARVDEDGVHHFHGREDRQVKIRGHRIELDDVAGALGGLPEVAECAVVTLPGRDGTGPELAAACVPADAPADAPPGDGTGTATALRHALARRLPGYMVPRHWLLVPALPRNRNGKTDHRAVEELFAGPGAGAPHTGGTTRPAPSQETS